MKMKFENFGNLHRTMSHNYKYFISFNGICRILEIVLIIGLNLTVIMTGLSYSCKIFVNITSGLVFLSASFWLTSNVLRPTKHTFDSTRWQEGFHDALSTLMLLVVATVLLFQTLGVPIGIAAFFSLSCALCFAVQGFTNFSSGRQRRRDKYLGKYEQDEVYLTDVAPKKPHRTFTITSADDDDSENELPLPSIVVNNVDEEQEPASDQSLISKHNVDEEQELASDQSLILKSKVLSPMITGVGGTPSPGDRWSDRSGMSEYHTPQETPSGPGNFATTSGEMENKPKVTWDPTAFGTPSDQTPDTPAISEEDLIDVGAVIGSPEITFNIKPMTTL